MIRRVALFMLSLIFIAVAFASCLDKQGALTPEEFLQKKLDAVDKTKLAQDIAVIEDSLELWNIEYFTEPKGVRYSIELLGSGPKPTLSSFIKIKYQARLFKDSTLYEQGDNFPTYLYDMIVGMQTTLPLLPEGTKATLFIPSGLAYGPYEVSDGNGVIKVPQNSNLIFTIELQDVQ